jgi:uncharacterized membrane protein YdjX (TVP38/TMEM64 family)
MATGNPRPDHRSAQAESAATQAADARQRANQQARRLSWLGGLLFIVLLVALWGPISQLGSDPAVIRRWIVELGPLAPVAYFLLNVIQIVVAPVPGYPVQVLGGILFGLIPGSIYAVGGMTAGGTLAAWVGRRLGRPWLEKQVGPDTLVRWQQLVHIDSFWVWWLLLLIPLGDIPYFFAGLSRIRLNLFALAILTSRGPFTVLIVWLGDRALNLPLTWVALLMAFVGLIVVVGLTYRERLELWGRQFVDRYLLGPSDSSDISSKT